MEEQEKATLGVIEFIKNHQADIANGVGDFADLRPMLKLIKEMERGEDNGGRKTDKNDT